ncbi:MAG: hypothetical protein AAF654_10960 [Myxococcota bacterium]
MPDALRLPARRPGGRWHQDIDGYWTAVKDYDSEEDFTLDWTDELGTDTIASVAVEEHGVTVATTNTETTTTHRVGQSDGHAVVRVTTAAGEKLVARLRFRDRNRRGYNDYDHL